MAVNDRPATQALIKSENPNTSFWDQEKFEDRWRELSARQRMGERSNAVDAPSPLSEALEEAYLSGMAGALLDPVETVNFEQLITGRGGDLDGERIARRVGINDQAAGQLVVPFRLVEQAYSGVWPGPAQERGDCVSHDTKNAALGTMVCDVASGKPDSKSGFLEALPKISELGIRNGGLSTETFYWLRGYDGDGWTCEAAAAVACSTAGLMPRNDYPELGINLEDYSGALAGKYGRKKPPEKILQGIGKNLVHQSTRLKTFADVRDYLANGFFPSTCGGEGWSSTRDENGYSPRSGSWSHAIGIIGADDRDVTKQKYGEPLVLFLNSWAKWNRGGRRILGTQWDIPEGAYWAKWSHASRRSILAFAGVNGFRAQALPSFDFVVG